jgi:hypothetical protein
VVGRLVRDDTGTALLDRAIDPYLRDIYDHAAGAAEAVDSAHDHILGSAAVVR